MATETLKALEHENEELEAENERLKAKLTRSPSQATGFWRALAITVCVALVALVIIVGNVLFWAGNTLINTDRYVKTVQPLLEDSAVQTAIADYTTTKLFNQVNVNGIVQQALPPRAAFLAPTLTSQLQNATDNTLRTALASNRFQTLWANTNHTAHDKLVASIKHSKGNGVVSLQDLYATLSQNLQGTKLSFLVGKSLPSNIGTITVINAPWIPKARFVVNNVGWLKPVSLLLIAGFAAAAIWLARRRRTIVILLGGLASLSMIATLIAIQIVRNPFVSRAAPAYQTAADHAANIILHPLVVQTIAILLAGIIIKIVAWITGPYKPAMATRRFTRRWLTKPIHNFIWRRENGLTNWFQTYKDPLQWVIVAVVAIVSALSEISPKEVVWRALLMLLAVLVVETIAAPHSSDKR